MNSSRNRLFRNPNRQPKQPTTVAVYSKYRAGHRGSYIDFVCRLLDATQSSLRSLYHHKGPVLFLLIEDSFFHYISACLWRSIFGKRTLGLLMLPKQALDGTSLRHRVKRLILQLLKRLPNVKTITILPHDLDPRLSSISDDWIYDFQFWDLGPSEYANYTRRRSLTHEHALVDRIRESAGKRCVVSAVGSQVASKGFHLLALFIIPTTALMPRPASDRVVSAGVAVGVGVAAARAHAGEAPRTVRDVSARRSARRRSCRRDGGCGSCARR